MTRERLAAALQTFGPLESIPHHPPGQLTHVINLRLDHAGRRFSGQGKGLTPEEAHIRASGELLERLCAWVEPSATFHLATIADMGPEAVDPRATQLFSHSQFRDRLPPREAIALLEELVPDPISVETVFAWAEACRLTDGRIRYLAAATAYFGFLSDGAAHCVADSNGLAVGETREDAMLHGLLELIERDAVAIWWYNQLRRPAAPLSWVDSEDCQALVLDLSRVEPCLLDLTTDLGVPVAAAVGHAGGSDDPLLFGFGANPDGQRAARSALLELAQCRANRATRPITPSPLRASGWTGAQIAAQDFLWPCTHAVPVHVSEVPSGLEAVVARLDSSGLEVIVLDLPSPPDTSCVKVVVPGLRPWFRRLAPGRLYGVPVSMGWRGTPLSECQVNQARFDL